MERKLAVIRQTLPLIGELKSQFAIETNTRNQDPLLYVGVVDSSQLDSLASQVENYFGVPYKAAGQAAFFRNLFDSFARAMGGMGKDQTFFVKKVDLGMTLFCAFWPWETNPAKTSVRIGLLCGVGEEKQGMIAALGGAFQ